MTGISLSKAAFIGSGALLVACAETWLAKGNAIRGVVTSCPIAMAWCERSSIPHIRPDQDQATWLGREAFDYLFSIVNHAITPAAVLKLPKVRAINYHDSPLPKYSGFNATSWAILNGETTHAITWHAMTADVDGGDILLQQSIDILDDDTAFSLGVKCAEAARGSFERLADMLMAEAGGAVLDVRAQGLREGFHVRSDRPGIGVIDFTQTVAQIRNFVRALNFGADDNWMCRPKLALQGGLVLAEAAEHAAKPSAAPGTVVAVDSKGIEIAAIDGVVRFAALTTLDGDAVDPLRVAQVGQILSVPADLAAASAADAVLTKQERFWVERLATMRPPAVPGLKLHPSVSDPALEVRKLPDALATGPIDRRAALIASLLAYVARTGEDEGFDLAITKAVPAGLGETYSGVTPFRVDVDRTGSFDALCGLVAAEIIVQGKRGSYARDVVTRYEVLRSRKEKPALTVGLQFRELTGLTPQAALAGKMALSLVIPAEGGSFAWAYDRRAMDDASLRMLADRFDVLVANGLREGATPVSKLEILPAAERKLLLETWQDTAVANVADRCVHELFESQVAKTPDAVAVRFRNASLTYRQLDERATAVADALRMRGVGPDVLVAVCMERSLDLAVGLMGVLKAGGAYVPLDPAYPRERLAMMLEDSAAKVLLCQRRLASELPSGAAGLLCIEDLSERAQEPAVQSAASPNNLAYVIFTSGSTGRPKGVMVRHRNVSNFFTGMDARIGTKPGVWLAVTSVSFDISVLELFWTLTRGFEVVIQSESDRASIAREPSASAFKQPMDFSLFYFAAGQGSSGPGGAYRLLLEGAKFADTHDFSAVWTPERHFHEFGGPYPNPAVTTAALATITSRIALRAGSLVLPLHNPLRVAEDWSVIDQLSGGRVGLSFASGWHADDFAFMPQNYERRREVMLESIETVTKLWRGEKVEAVNGQGKTISVRVLPRPVQAKPPMWIASAGSVDTFKLAGRIGANVLTNMLGQDIDDLRNKFAAYREARRDAGHEGPGAITVMLHTFVCEDTEKARELAREPFCNYLRSSFDLVKVAPQMFPAFRQPSLDAGEAKNFDATKFNDDDMAALMEHAFDRYFETAGLFGSPKKALAMIDRLKSIGATEVACLIDFGIDTDLVIESLPYLDQLRRMSNTTDEEADPGDYSIAARMRDCSVTHLQCTPSFARMIASDAEGLAAMSRLERLILGGEALPTDLAELLTPVVKGEIHNMYGPTETTIWSTTSRVVPGEQITIGRPIANTIIRILDANGQIAPVGAPGELCIGGAGVAAGYLGRPDLTAERFVPDSHGAGLIYRTGDLARYSANGDIEFLGRLDHQVKLNGYRIELGEIETVLGRHEFVGQAVVTARADDGVQKLVAYITPPKQAADANGAEQVARWQGLWDGAYREAASVPEPRFNTAGWSDSATGAPIPAEQMREWLDGVEQSVLALSPKRVLEIGCGTGMVLYRLLSHVEHYTGVDLSSHALDVILAELSPSERERVELKQQPAHALDGIPNKSCDTVIINSVAQYFPDAAYLEKVLRRVIDTVCDGGAIFVGDVRSRDHLEAFHTWVALQQVPANASKADITARIDRRIAQEGELVVSEAFFHALAREIPRLGRVEARLKPGQAGNEMSAFRYDVVIHVGDAAPTASVAPVVASYPELWTKLEQGADAVLVKDVSNARVAGLYAARAALAGADAIEASFLRAVAASKPQDAVEPMDLARLHSDYSVEVIPARSGDPARFDAVFRNRRLDPSTAIDCGAPGHDKPAGHYVRSPGLAAVKGVASADELRAHLRELLPEYMIPSAFVVLDELPLTPNGKIDRKALPRPVQAATAPVTTAYVAPSNAIEETIAGVWKALLGLERVGLRDNIFDLGANSLLTVQANQRLSGLLDRKIALVSMFRYPTVEALAAHLAEGLAPAEPITRRAQERDSRKKDAAERRRELRAGSKA
ncbi:MAG: LLM class flavin-dependent oxidoreductase [Hyphomonadaceae bacterium]